MNLHTPRIGSFVLDTLTTGMYTNPLDVIREYIQNSTDSIMELSQNNSVTGRVEVDIDPRHRRVIIRDDGVGIPSNDIGKSSHNIGMSNKNLQSSAGFRGIGRLAGIAYCDKLRFRTSSINEETTSIVEIDCKRLRALTSPQMREIKELAEVISSCTSIENEPAEKSQHFFEVILDHIIPDADQFLKWDSLENYLCQVAPVDYDSQSFLPAPKIKNWIIANKVQLPVITLVLKAPEIERQIFKPFRCNYHTQHVRGGNFPFRVKDVNFFPENISHDAPFWLWYGQTDLLGTIDDERVAGLRFRVKNISIGGPERVAEIFGIKTQTNYRFNAWYLGEIHILSNSIIPNARRDGFEDNPEWARVKKEIQELVDNLSNTIRQQSQERNRPAQVAIRNARKVLSDANERIARGLLSEQQKHDLIERLNTEVVKTEAAAQSKKDTPDEQVLVEIRDQLEDTLTTLTSTSSYMDKKLPSNLDRKQRKIIMQIINVLQKALDSHNFQIAEKAILESLNSNSNKTK